MSFIYDDPNLVVRLLSDALEDQFKFTKRGQDAIQQARANILAMVKSLETQLDPNQAQNQANQIAWEGDQQPTLASPNLESLGDLVHWLVQSKITVGGQRVAFDGKENPNQPGWILYRLETHAATPDQRGADPGGFYVNPNLLKGYIVQLQQYETQNPNPTMRFQLGRLVEETNHDLGTNIGSQYQAPDKVLRDTVVLDNVPDVFVNVQSSGYGGNIPLTYGDLKDEMSFNGWLQGKSIQFLTQVQGKPAKVMVGAPGFDTCAVLKILMYRATHITPTTQQEKDQAQIYARQVSVVAKDVNCDLSGQASQPGSTNPQGGNQNAGAGGASEQQVKTSINEIVDALPLQLQNIDFNRIKTFEGQMAQLMGSNPTITSYISATNELMAKATAFTKNGDTFFQLGISPTAVVNMLKPNAQGFAPANFFILVQTLDQIVDNVRAMVDYFMSAYASKATDQQRALIYGQVGKRPDDNSIYSRNIEYLNQWMSTSHT